MTGAIPEKYTGSLAIQRSSGALNCKRNTIFDDVLPFLRADQTGFLAGTLLDQRRSFPPWCCLWCCHHCCSTADQPKDKWQNLHKYLHSIECPDDPQCGLRHQRSIPAGLGFHEIIGIECLRIYPFPRKGEVPTVRLHARWTRRPR